MKKKTSLKVNPQGRGESITTQLFEDDFERRNTEDTPQNANHPSEVRIKKPDMFWSQNQPQPKAVQHICMKFRFIISL